MTRRSITILLATAVLAGGAGGAAPAMAADPATAGAPAPVAVAAAPAAVARTEVRFQVRGCNGCTISVQRALSPNSGIQPPMPDYWNGPRAKVRNGSATLSVPTAYTAGMSFVIRAPWETGSFDAVTNIVLGAEGVSPGTRLSAAQIRSTRRATACWAGTAEPSATLRVRVVPTTRRGLDGPSTIPMSWAKPTVDTVGKWFRTARGILGNQDAFFC